ncbi:MAG TPA: helix-turn-helix transcriptional regulator [Rhizomicrobium sp.]|jgi:transcriptional regulator with XRE-family HTH domain
MVYREKTDPSAAKQPGEPDRYIGSRLILARKSRGISQESLAQALKISFQQVQKYEKGTNRISASRLFEISHLLDVDIVFFFDGLEQFRKEQLPSADPKESGEDSARPLVRAPEAPARARTLKFRKLKRVAETED